MTKERYYEMPMSRDVYLTTWDGAELVGRRQGYWIVCGSEFLSYRAFAGWREISTNVSYETH